MSEGSSSRKRRRDFLDRIDDALDAFSLTRRGRFWLRLLGRAWPETVGGWLRYVTSAVIDTFVYSTRPTAHPIPLLRYPLTIHLRKEGARLSLREKTDDIVHSLPGREQDVHHTILDSLRPGDTLVDVGANIGYYTVLGGLRVGPGGRVVAIEPLPSTSAVLRKNVRMNSLGNVRIIEAAAGAEPRERARISFDPRHLGRATLRAATGSEGREVRVTTLDRVCRELQTIRLLKIDVEGNELAVLRGAVRTLEKTEQIVLESNEDSVLIDRFLEDRGFEIRRLRFTNHRWARRVQPGHEAGRGS